MDQRAGLLPGVRGGDFMATPTRAPEKSGQPGGAKPERQVPPSQHIQVNWQRCGAWHQV